jgi:hypothetical protein
LSDNKSHWSNLTQSLQNDTMTHVCRMIRQSSCLTDFKYAKMSVTDWNATSMLAAALKESTTIKSVDLSRQVSKYKGLIQ